MYLLILCIIMKKESWIIIQGLCLYKGCFTHSNSKLFVFFSTLISPPSAKTSKFTVWQWQWQCSMACCVVASRLSFCLLWFYVVIKLIAINNTQMIYLIFLFIWIFNYDLQSTISYSHFYFCYPHPLTYTHMCKHHTYRPSHMHS